MSDYTHPRWAKEYECDDFGNHPRRVRGNGWLTDYVLSVRNRHEVVRRVTDPATLARVKRARLAIWARRIDVALNAHQLPSRHFFPYLEKPHYVLTGSL